MQQARAEGASSHDTWLLIRERVQRAVRLLEVPADWRDELEQHLCLRLEQRVANCFDGQAPLVHYIDKNAWLDARKWLIRQRRPRELSVPEPERLPPCDAPSQLDGDLWRSLGMSIDEVMIRLDQLGDRLPPLQRQAWFAARQRFHEDRSWREIADELGEDPQRLMERWGQARNKLRGWLLDPAGEV